MKGRGRRKRRTGERTEGARGPGHRRDGKKDAEEERRAFKVTAAAMLRPRGGPYGEGIKGRPSLLSPSLCLLPASVSLTGAERPSATSHLARVAYSE